MPTRCLLILLGSAVLTAALYAQQVPAPNYDESKVPAYTLPDPLLGAGGEHVTASIWPERRTELLATFAREVYGRTPAGTVPVAATVTDDDPNALGGRAHRRQITLTFGKAPHTVSADVLIYLPKTAGPVPAVLGLNFEGNHAITADPGVRLPQSWMADSNKGVVKNRATEASRGADVARWPVDMILSHGYALVTAYYGDFDPDFDDGFQNGVQPLFYQPGQTRPAADEWGAIGAWSWGLSRILDQLETDRSIDAHRVAVFGHSRLGKAALWAAAQDPRFALVISNESGCGGAALNKRIYGETVKAINDQFPHWFDANFKRYNGREADLPVDAHELLALIAPRPLYVASAIGDQWADPKGEFLAAVHADPVYQLLGVHGLGTTEMPAVEHPVGDTVRYHIRNGEHDVKPYDWQQYLAFMDAKLERRPAGSR